ncbi:reverse transcriptase domain-containing protein [Pseudomonas sp. P9_35]|uniref:reverse transcriptase domain-containing protein n=1 Tax=unclassified Pseudomonas TaxID=196821 RepID=UPI002A359839|nr:MULTISPECIES: reverse transcriptase domain-containing protein [unclassified Pseudomonas]WPN63500.1 reverse transcriptase domain-containing protein [Pseudomonas sp. P9_32]WPN69252.1 reverse transcriptase domain-containing protein [Pseudomonas sp. P9_35]
MNILDEILKDMFAPGLSSLSGLCDLLGVKQETLLDFLYKRKSSHYVSFHIPKKSGATRSIKAPKRVMKQLQRELAPHLENFFYPKSSTHGFVKGRNIKSNALPHVDKKFVFNIDLKDFFESIHFGRVKNLFMAEPFNAPHNVATVIAHICCDEGRLVQGAPTSPLISNMICRKLDSQLLVLAKSKKCHVTRYADDITFSFTSSLKFLPVDLIEISEDGRVIPGRVLEQVINANGFIINSEKTRLQHCTQRQMVTGLVVNKFPNVPRDFIRLTSSMIHAWKRYGAALAEAKYLEIMKGAKQTMPARQHQRVKDREGDFFIKVVKGRLNYIQMIRGRSDNVYRKLAYDFTVALGKANPEFRKTPEEILGNSIFVVENLSDYSQGTAFLLDGVGIVTNQHVVSGVSKTMAPHMLTFTRSEDKTKITAELILSDVKADLAIFHPGSQLQKIPRLRKAEKEVIRPMEPILSIGFPKHRDGAAHYITRGSTTQLRRHVDLDLWLVDVPLIEGNSGGPIFNDSMEVIGVASRGVAQNNIQAALYGFIPIESLNRFTSRVEFKFLRALYVMLNGNALRPLSEVSGKYVRRSQALF